jgi:hypothetical protein
VHSRIYTVNGFVNDVDENICENVKQGVVADRQLLLSSPDIFKYPIIPPAEHFSPKLCKASKIQICGLPLSEQQLIKFTPST